MNNDNQSITRYIYKKWFKDEFDDRVIKFNLDSSQ